MTNFSHNDKTITNFITTKENTNNSDTIENIDPYDVTFVDIYDDANIEHESDFYEYGNNNRLLEPELNDNFKKGGAFLNLKNNFYSHNNSTAKFDDQDHTNVLKNISEEDLISRNNGLFYDIPASDFFTLSLCLFGLVGVLILFCIIILKIRQNQN